jgi:hypothetical protein
MKRPTYSLCGKGYALAIDVNAPKTDKTFANQRKARDILVPIFATTPA